uniref:VOC family protein n=1 Tax=Acetatifactor sp. TaxID=1872090 RepID=UPI0040563209
MKLKNILLVVNDIELSKSFYKELFGLDVVTDFGGNVMLTEGLVLQERKLWEKAIHQASEFGGHDAELYFEERDMEGFLKKLKGSTFKVEYLSEPAENDWGRRVVRIYDPDKHVIEVADFNVRGEY